MSLKFYSFAIIAQLLLLSNIVLDLFAWTTEPVVTQAISMSQPLPPDTAPNPGDRGSGH